MAALSTLPPFPDTERAAWPAALAAFPPPSPTSADCGKTATDSQSLPMSCVPGGAGRVGGSGAWPVQPEPGLVTVCTLAPGGGRNAKLAGAGRTNEIEV